MDQPRWVPTREQVEGAAMTALMRRRGFDDYHQLWPA